MASSKKSRRVTGDAVLYSHLLNVTRDIAMRPDVEYAVFAGETIRIDFVGGKSVVFAIEVLADG